jgi:ribosomal protein S18 acetylase RimI-like enzyme
MAIESKYKLEELVRGTIQICERFLGLAIRIGIWDCTLRKFSDSDQLLILQQTALSQENAHFHLNNMIAMFDTTNNVPVATCCGYPYPKFTISKTIDCIQQLILSMHPDFPPEDLEEMKSSLDFLEESFPTEIDYEGSWMIEVVYTLPEHRGKGIAQQLIQYQLDKGKALGFDRALITCSIGNENARRLYEKCGFQLVGQGTSEACQKAIHSPGFYVLQISLH